MSKQIKKENGFEAHSSIKFSFDKNSKTTKQQHTKAKNNILEMCIEEDVTGIICVTLHKIAKNKEPKKLQEWASNVVFRKFDEYLCSKNSHGVVIIDNWPYDDVYSHLEKNLKKGITYSSGAKYPLSKILLYAQSGIRACELNSLVDVIIGGLRYVINDREKTEVPKVILPRICQILWGDQKGNDYDILDKGLNFSPQKVQIPEYRKEYKDLIEHLNIILDNKTMEDNDLGCA